MEMKKYMTPEMDVVEMKVQGMLAASAGETEGGSGSLPEEITPGDPE